MYMEKVRSQFLSLRQFAESAFSPDELVGNLALYQQRLLV